MTQKFYSYYSLVRKDAGFNCLSSLACVYKSTVCSVTIRKNDPYYGTYAQVYLGHVNYNFVPLAEILSGVFIRGGELKNDSTGEFYLPTETRGMINGAFVFTAASYGGTGSGVGTSTLHSYYSRGYETPRRGPSSNFTNTVYAEIHETNNTTYPASRLQFNPSTMEGSIDLRFDASILSYAQDRFAIDYPSQNKGFNNLAPVTIGEILTFQGDTSLSSQTFQIGSRSSESVVDLGNVLFTIPFN